jgi:cation diffusion facilitator CzcD-associated flavoprotein CzcO
MAITPSRDWDSNFLPAHHFKKHLSHAYEFHIVEKNHDVGGTWLENTYPGKKKHDP